MGSGPVPGLSCRRTSPTGGRSYFLTEKPTPRQLQQVLADAGIHPAMKFPAGETDGVGCTYCTASRPGRTFFVANQNHTVLCANVQVSRHGRRRAGMLGWAAE